MAAAICLALATYLFLQQEDQRQLRTANELGLAEQYEAAIAEARRVTRAPADAHALLVRAHAAQALGRHRDAIALFRRAAERDPRSWHLHRDWAISLMAMGRRRAARERLEITSTLNPRFALPPGF